MNRAELRERISVPRVMEMLGLDVPRGNPGHVHCLVHEDDTASLAIYDDHVFCYGCGWATDVVGFTQVAAGLNRGRAIAWLSGVEEDVPLDVHVDRHEPVVTDMTELFWHDALGPSQTVDDVKHLCDARWPHLTPYDLYDFGVRANKHNLLIPHWHEGKVVGIKTRSLLGDLGAKRSYKGSTFTLRPYSVGAVRGQVALVVEGESDTWTMTKAHPDWMVFGMPSGASTWRSEWHDEWLSAWPKVFVGTDNDDAGHAAAERIMRGHDYERLLPPAGFDDWSEAAAAGVSV